MFFAGNYGVETYLELFSEDNFDAFCLAYMFTYRDFEGGTLGLAWTGDLQNAGGVCEKNGVSAEAKHLEVSLSPSCIARIKNQPLDDEKLPLCGFLLHIHAHVYSVLRMNHHFFSAIPRQSEEPQLRDSDHLELRQRRSLHRVPCHDGARNRSQHGISGEWRISASLKCQQSSKTPWCSWPKKPRTFGSFGQCDPKPLADFAVIVAFHSSWEICDFQCVTCFDENYFAAFGARSSVGTPSVSGLMRSLICTLPHGCTSPITGSVPPPASPPKFYPTPKEWCTAAAKSLAKSLVVVFLLFPVGFLFRFWKEMRKNHES